MSGGNGAAVTVHPVICGITQTKMFGKGHGLNGKGLVQLNQIDVIDLHSKTAQHLFGGRNRTPAHDGGINAGKGIADHAHLGFNAQLLAFFAGQQQRGAGPVIKSGGISRGDLAAYLERGLEILHAIQGDVRSGLFILVSHFPAARSENRHVDTLIIIETVLQGLEIFLLAMEGIFIGLFAGDFRITVFHQPVMQPFGGAAHVEIFHVQHLLGKDPGVGIGTLAHGMMTHVFNTAGDDLISRIGLDLGPAHGLGCHAAGAHPVKRHSRNSHRHSRSKHGCTAHGDTLVTGLGCSTPDVVIGLVQIHRRVSPPDLHDTLVDQIIRPGGMIKPVRPGFPEPSANTVYKIGIP